MAKKKPAPKAKSKRPAKKIKFAKITLKGKRPQQVKLKLGKRVKGLSVSISKMS